MRLPVSSLSLPSPTASTLPLCGFSFAVSGRTIPEAVVVSSSTALTIRRSPSGLSFIGRSLRWHAGKKAVGTRHTRVPKQSRLYRDEQEASPNAVRARRDPPPALRRDQGVLTRRVRGEEAGTSSGAP